MPSAKSVDKTVRAEPKVKNSERMISSTRNSKTVRIRNIGIGIPRVSWQPKTCCGLPLSVVVVMNSCFRIIPWVSFVACRTEIIFASSHVLLVECLRGRSKSTRRTDVVGSAHQGTTSTRAAASVEGASLQVLASSTLLKGGVT